eukprot:7144193-Prymnesium_polylepis.1
MGHVAFSRTYRYPTARRVTYRLRHHPRGHPHAGAGRKPCRTALWAAGMNETTGRDEHRTGARTRADERHAHRDRVVTRTHCVIVDRRDACSMGG